MDAVDLLHQLFAALGKADAVLLAFVQGADDLGLALAGGGGERGHHGHVEHHGVDALAEQFKEHAVVVGELLQFLRLAEVLHERYGRGAGLHGNDLAGEILNLADVLFVFTDEDLEAGRVIAVGELHDLGAFRRDGHAGDAHIHVAGLEAGDDTVEIHRLKLVGETQLLGDGFPEFNVKTGELAVRPLEFKGHEVGVVSDDKFFGRGGGDQHGHEGKTHDQGSDTFHYQPL